MAETLVSWQIPEFERSDDTKLGFLRRCISQGIAWQQENCNSTSMQKAMDILAGKTGGQLSSKWAHFTTGDLKRGVLEIVETLSDIRPYWGYSTDNKSFLEQANMMSKTAKAIYMESFVDRAIKDALQYAAVSGAGFIYPFYTLSKFGSGGGKFEFMALGQPDIWPIQLPRGRDYQEAYIVTLAIPFGIAKAHALFPEYQQFLKPFAKRKYGRTKGGEDRRAYDAARWRFHNLDGQLEQFCDVYYTYVLDLRVNFGEVDHQGKPVLDEEGNPIGKELEMGQAGTSWAYKVPYVGQTITRFENGRSVTRPATEDDCRVYPQRRLLISCDTALMYDGPAFDWHGMVPLIPFYLDEWAWEPTGYSLFNGTAATQDAIDDLARSIYRVAMARAKPGKVYNIDITTGDKTGKLTSRQAEGIDPLSPDITWGIDGDIKEPVMRPPMPEWCYNIPEWIFKVIEILQGSMMRQLGLDAVKSLEKLRANISDPEKLLDAEGPTVMGTSRSMERGLRDLGEMMKYNILQYMTTGQVMQIVGADGIAPQVFDYAPDKVIPSHLPGEQTIDAQQQQVGSAADEFTRAKTFAKNLRFFITPHSLHYIAQAQQRLNLLALLGKGVPVDPETIASQFDLPNWGTIEGSTIKEKVFNWAKEQLTEKAEIARLEQALGLGPPPEPGGKPGPHPGQPGAGHPPKHPGKGTVKQKGTASGGRAVVATT
ncbi:MAG: hypothetical protein WA213_20810 [Terriglobales bacterium]